MPETLGSDGKQVYIQIDEGVACLELESGKPVWTYGGTGARVERKRVTYGTNTLVVVDGVVLCKLSDKLTALSAKDGSKLWECPADGGFHSPLDVFVIGGLVWQGSHVSDSVSPPPVRDFNEGRDLFTGEVKQTNTVAVDLQTSGHHHRCYREKATDRFIITGKRGIEMMDLAGDDHSRNNWVRGTCQYGILPANGLTYAPPHACGCYMESKLRGFWALASDRQSRAANDDARETSMGDRLERGPAYATAGSLPSALDDPSSNDWPVYRHDARRSGVAKTVLPGKMKQAWRTELKGRLTQPIVAGGKVVLSAVDENTVFALDEKTGEVLWRRIVGGPVDSPPAIYRGMALFGSADGQVYCLRLSDGELVWRFLVAPADVRSVAFDRVESLWPVHGSVLILDGVAYCSAGRSTWLDGGIDLYGLDPATGEVVCRTHFESQHPKFQEGKELATAEHETRIDQNTTDYKTFLAFDRSDAFSMAGGAISDVLVSDGRNVFLHHVKFNAALKKQDHLSRHLFSTSSLLDDSESHRSHWVLGTGDFSRVPVAYSWIVNRPGKRMPTIAVPTAVMMVFGEDAVWGVRRQGDANGKYYLFKMRNRPFSESEEFLPDFRRIPSEKAIQYVWRHDFPLRTSAMLKSGDNLYLGVAGIEIPEDDPHSAYEGRMGGKIWVCSQQDGRKLAEYGLESPVVWDGMSAANGKLFLSTSAGVVLCFSESK
jgi:outer membrane protein assembly factor BamB